DAGGAATRCGGHRLGDRPRLHAPADEPRARHGPGGTLRRGRPAGQRRARARHRGVLMGTLAAGSRATIAIAFAVALVAVACYDIRPPPVPGAERVPTIVGQIVGGTPGV